MKTPSNILIVRPDRLGDLILSLPVAETLKTNMPNCKITYLASFYAAAIGPMVDYVDEWLVDSDGGGSKLSMLLLTRKMKEGDFDCIIELKPSWRTAMAGRLSGTKLRIGTLRRFYSFFYNSRLPIHRKASGYHQTELELKHIEQFDIENKINSPSLSVTVKGLEKALVLLSNIGNRFVVIHPGSGGSAPNWPLNLYQTLARLLKNKLECDVVITNNTVIPGFEHCMNLGGKTNLETLAGVFSKASLFISGSTGPLHMADALGVKCLSLFISRPDIGPVRWGPGRNLDNVLAPSKECSCSDLRRCKCLEQVTPEYALAKAEELLLAWNGSEVGQK